MPSAWAVLTSLFPINARTALESFFTTASASVAGAAASDEPTRKNKTQMSLNSEAGKSGTRPSKLGDRFMASWLLNSFVFSNRQRREQLVDLAVAVGERIDSHARFIEEREVQVRERHRLF